MSEDDHSHEPCCEHTHDNRFETVSLIVSGVLVGAALLAGQLGAGGPSLTTLLASTGMLAGGWFLLPKAWRAVRRLRPDINLLVVIAAIGASVIGEWVEASAVVFLFGVAEWLEGWADRRARRATEALL